MASFPRNVVFVRIQTYSRMKIHTQEYTKVFTGTERGMDGGISMVSEICTDDDAEGDTMEASVNGRRRRRCQNTTFSTQVQLINTEKQRFKEMIFVRVRLA